MSRPTLELSRSNVARAAKFVALALCLLCAARYGTAQDTPLLSGGIGFFTSTNGGQTTYQPVIEPLLAAPIGHRFLVESRAALLEFYSPKGNGQSGFNKAISSASRIFREIISPIHISQLSAAIS